MSTVYQKAAIFGGTFNPIHIGHLLIAEQAYEAFSLDKVIFMPAGMPPHKVNKEIIYKKHRLEMVKLAINNNPHFGCSDYELNKKGNSYTVETLRYFREQNLARQVYFIIGADSLYDIFDWKESEYLLENANFIVADRPGYNLRDLLKEDRLQPYLENIQVIDEVLVNISSSRIRERVRYRESIRYQTSDNVIKYIKEKGLYRGD